jgi:hypothetical protein
VLPLADAEADRLLASIPQEVRWECWWLVLRDRTLIAGDGGGGVALFAELRLTRGLAGALRVLRASWVVDALDKLLARHRTRLGRLVPDGPAPRRYP